MFEEEDDAERYKLMLESDEDSKMNVIEIDDALAIMTCKRYNYKYAVITPNDIVIPPKVNDNLPESYMEKLPKYRQSIYGSRFSKECNKFNSRHQWNW